MTPATSRPMPIRVELPAPVRRHFRVEIEGWTTHNGLSAETIGMLLKRAVDDRTPFHVTDINVTSPRSTAPEKV